MLTRLDGSYSHRAALATARAGPATTARTSPSPSGSPGNRQHQEVLAAADTKPKHHRAGTSHIIYQTTITVHVLIKDSLPKIIKRAEAVRACLCVCV